MDIDYNKTEVATKFNGINIIAIDYGQKFSGLAMFRPGFDLSPYPFDRIAYKGDDALAKSLVQLIDNELIEVVVLGLPHLTDGTATNMTKTVENFGKVLLKVLPKGVKMFTQDETLSSFEAKDRMQNSARYNFKIDMKKIDEVAASIILEDFLKSDVNSLKNLSENS